MCLCMLCINFVCMFWKWKAKQLSQTEKIQAQTEQHQAATTATTIKNMTHSKWMCVCVCYERAWVLLFSLFIVLFYLCMYYMFKTLLYSWAFIFYFISFLWCVMWSIQRQDIHAHKVKQSSIHIAYTAHATHSHSYHI